MGAQWDREAQDVQVACVFVGAAYRQKEVDKDGDGEIKIETDGVE